MKTTAKHELDKNQVRYLRDLNAHGKSINALVELSAVPESVLRRHLPATGFGNSQYANRGTSQRALLNQRLKNLRQASRRNGYAAPTFTVDDILPRRHTCDACGVPERECSRALSIDHDHETGEFRGWLCDSCNFVLGATGDSPMLLRKLAGYLEGSP